MRRFAGSLHTLVPALNAASGSAVGSLAVAPAFLRTYAAAAEAATSTQGAASIASPLFCFACINSLYISYRASTPCAHRLQKPSNKPRTPTVDTYNVPLGHHGATLDSVHCHIGLGRRRDITLRSYISLHDGAKGLSCAELFRGKNTVVLGVPGGSICTKTHIPEFAARFADLKARGVNQVVVVTQEPPASMAAWAKEAGVDGAAVRLVSDEKGYFTRLIGTEIVADKGPRNQR